MSILVILLPSRTRLCARDGPQSASAPPAEFDYLLSADGLAITSAGRAAPAALPRADQVVAVLADGDVGFHRVALPKAPAARLRAALVGLLEDSLLDDEEALHFALAPGLAGGHEGWVAVVHRGWLGGLLAILEAANVPVDRVVPHAVPGEPARGHFCSAAEGDAGAPSLVLAQRDGVLVLRAEGTLARALVPAGPVEWSATPAAVAAAEHWLGAPVAVQTEAERAFAAAQSAWNLRQFELVVHHRGLRVLRDAWRRLRAPEWRPLRWGAALLVVLQLIGLNAHAWQERHAIEARRQAMEALLRRTHPGVRAVIDAPAQMRRETEQLRTAAGRAGADDLESLLAAAAAAWPEGQGPVQALRFEPGKLDFAATGWTDAQTRQFRDRLAGSGYRADPAEGRMRLVRAADRGAR